MLTLAQERSSEKQTIHSLETKSTTKSEKSLSQIKQSLKRTRRLYFGTSEPQLVTCRLHWLLRACRGRWRRLRASGAGWSQGRACGTTGRCTLERRLAGHGAASKTLNKSFTKRESIVALFRLFQICVSRFRFMRNVSTKDRFEPN